MPIETIIAGISPELRARFERDAERAKHMTVGQHLQDWLDFEVSLWGIRHEAMRAAFTNQPKGRGYNEAMSALMAHYGLDKLDRTSVSGVLWLTDQADKYGPELLTRKQILDAVLTKMTPQERSRLGSPITARQRVEAVIRDLARADDAETKRRESPIAMLKKQLADAQRELAEARAALKSKDDGSLFDLKTDTPDVIARVIVAHATDNKVDQLLKALTEQRKRKRQKPAG